MTIESSINCFVALTLSQNKKVDDFEVSKYREHGSSQEDLVSEKPDTAAPQEEAGALSTKKTINAITQMLGMDESKLNATKANRIMRKKIQYMIHEESVAEGFLELVDQLKSIKSKNHAKLVSSVKKAKQDSAGRDLLMSNIFNNGMLLLSDEVDSIKAQDQVTLSKYNIA